MIDAQEIMMVAPKLKPQRLQNLLPSLQEGATKYKINTFLRETMYVAQLLEESGGFQWFREFASGREYEGRRDLGNIYPGDGERFKGRGPIELTGRANYVHYGALLGLDLVGHPEWVETPQVGFLVSACYWDQNGLNRYADARNLRACTRVINGGLNGYAERERYYALCLQRFSRNDPKSPISDEDRIQPPTSTPDGTDVEVLFNDQPILNPDDPSDQTIGFLEDGRVWAPLRPVCQALLITIFNVVHGTATLEDTVSGTKSNVRCRIIGSRGFSPVKEVANFAEVAISFDQKSKVVHLG